MDRYVLFGQSVRHSLSPRIHQLFAKQTRQSLTYEAQSVALEHFPQVFHAFFAKGGQGANVTAPFKTLAACFVDQLTPAAAAPVGAVNTVITLDDDRLLGDNSDGIGLVKDLQRQQLLLTGARILLIGAGGAARGILLPLLATQPTEVVLLNRTLATAIQLAAECAPAGPVKIAAPQRLNHGLFDLVIQATSAHRLDALYPWLASLHWEAAACYDLNYQPTPTPFLQWASQQGASRLSDGLGMLVEQAAYAFQCWRQVTPSVEEVLHTLRRELA
jgi:shikimate dehydrogenase